MCDCIIDAATLAKMVCIEDFCGQCTHQGFHHAIQFWADWDSKVVHFGGDWQMIPHMQAIKKPTNKSVTKHVKNAGYVCAYYHIERK